MIFQKLRCKLNSIKNKKYMMEVNLDLEILSFDLFYDLFDKNM